MEEVQMDGIRIDKVCRSCLKERAGLQSLFSAWEGPSQPAVAYSGMLMASASVDVSEGDGLPPHICEPCRVLLVQASSFRTMCERADARLRSVLGLEASRKHVFSQTREAECAQFFNCGDCQKKFKAVSSLQKHLRRHTRGSGAACHICGNLYGDPEALAKHMGSAHAPGGGAAEGKEEMWAREMKTEGEAARISIKEEPQEDGYQEELDEDNHSEGLEESRVKHEYQSDRSHTPIQFEKKKVSKRKGKRNNSDLPDSHPCSFCNRVFSSKGHLKSHEAKHVTSKQQRHVCGVCAKGFNKASHLKRHQLTHTGEGEGEPQSPQHLAEEHHQLEINKNPKVAFCNVCQRGFTTQRYLEIHLKSHSQASGRDGGDVPTVVRGFPCKCCQHVSENKAEARAHTQWHRRAERPFLCSECGQGFTRDAYLTVHMRRHRGEKPFSCGYCGKGFPRRSDLDIHERYHTEDKRHTCTICGKAFHRQYNLKVHLRVHTGERPYACTYCPKAFTQPNDLKAHVRRHTGERFTCDLCSAQFLHGYHLTQHRRAVHAVDKPSHIRRLSKFPSSGAPNPPVEPTQLPTRGRARQAHIQLAAHMASILAAQQQPPPAAPASSLSQPPPT